MFKNGVVGTSNVQHRTSDVELIKDVRYSLQQRAWRCDVVDLSQWLLALQEKDQIFRGHAGLVLDAFVGA
jgi:hypothetical protein